MRILMAVPKYPFPVVGGLEGQAHQLAKTLVQRGHRVHALSSRFAAAQQEEETVEGVHVHRVNKWIEFAPARFLLFPIGLAALLVKLRGEVDLVHVHNLSWFGAFVTLAAKAMGLPVLTKLPNFGDFGIARMQRRAFGFLRLFLLKRSDAVVAMTAESLAELAAIGYPMAKVLKAVNGITDLASTTVIAADAAAPVTVIFVGRLSPEKGLIDLFHAWVMVRRVAPNSRLRLIGAGPQGDALRALAVQLDLGAAVQFPGYCKDVPAELAKADLFVLPSYAEGNSNAILEAMRAGLPVVATDVGGAAIQLGGAGADFLVAPGDRQALAERLLALIENPALRRHVGQAMRTRIEDAFTMERVAAIYEQAFELIVRGRAEQLCRLNAGLFPRTMQ